MDGEPTSAPARWWHALVDDNDESILKGRAARASLDLASRKAMTPGLRIIAARCTREAWVDLLLSVTPRTGDAPSDDEREAGRARKRAHDAAPAEQCRAEDEDRYYSE